MGINFYGGDTESGDVFIVETKAKPGMLLESHKHQHAHLSVLVSGIADVCIDDVCQRIEGYQLVRIPAGTVHKVQAVTDIIWLCLWADDLAPKQKAYDSLDLFQ